MLILASAYSVLQLYTLYYSYILYTTVIYSILQLYTLYYSYILYITAIYSILQLYTLYYSYILYITVIYSILQLYTLYYSYILYTTVIYSILQLCFPHGVSLYEEIPDQPLTFHPFIITREDGSKVHAASLSFYEQVTTSITFTLSLYNLHLVSV